MPYTTNRRGRNAYAEVFGNEQSQRGIPVVDSARCAWPRLTRSAAPPFFLTKFVEIVQNQLFSGIMWRQSSLLQLVARSDPCLSAADWKTALRASVHVPLKSTSMKKAARAATRAERNTNKNSRKQTGKQSFQFRLTILMILSYHRSNR